MKIKHPLQATAKRGRSDLKSTQIPSYPTSKSILCQVSVILILVILYYFLATQKLDSSQDVFPVPNGIHKQEINKYEINMNTKTKGEIPPAPQDKFGFDVGPLAVIGTFPAALVAIDEKYDVERPMFQSSQTEIVDLLTLLFAYKHEGEIYKVSTPQMRISGSEKSNMIKFFTAWLGRRPQAGWRWSEMLGKSCVLSVGHHETKKGSMIAVINSIAPMNKGLVDDLPTKSEVEELIEEYQGAEEEFPIGAVESEKEDVDVPY